MAAPERSILEIMQEAGQEPPRVQLPPAIAEGGDNGDGAATGRAGRYEVIGPLAEGGVGEVLRGRDLDLGREVALKVLREKHRSNPELVQRLLDEAQIGGQLQHPGIVPVYEIGVDEEQRPFLAMKLVKGKTLAARLAERTDPTDGRRRFLRLFEQLAQAVAYAHARGVVHRDLKPSNVMVGAFGEVQVLDWGFAKVLRRGGLADEHRADTRDADVTRIATARSTEGSSIAGSVMGTPAYMPPEQALGEIDRLDERCDVFALGAILCEILTGSPPYVGKSEDLLTLAAGARLDDAYERLDACDANASLVTLCRECLQPLRGDRPRDAFVVAERVHDYLASVEERARKARIAAAEARAASEKAEAEAQRQQRGRRQSLLVGVGVLALLVAAIGGAWGVRADAREQATRTANAAAVAMEDAERLHGEGRLADAETAALRAEAVVREGEATDELTASVETVLASIRKAQAEEDARLAQQAKNETMVRELRRIERLEVLATGGATRSQTADAAYAEAFRTYGLDLEASSPEEAGAAMRASAIHLELLRGMEQWIGFRQAARGEQDTSWRTLAAVADAADPDPWTSRVRRATYDRDLDTVRRLAQDAEALESAPSRAVPVARWLSGVGENERARQLVDRYLVRHPDDEDARLMAVLLAVRLGDPRSARRHALALLALDPSSADAHRTLSVACWNDGDTRAALQWAERGLKTDPESLGEVDRIVALHRSLKTLDGALEEWNAALEKEPDTPRLLALVGTAHLQARGFDSAEKHLQRLRELRPQSAHACNLQARVRLGTADDAAAYELLARAVSLDPADVSRPHTMGSLMGVMSGPRAIPYADAVERFETLLPEASSETRCQFLLGYAGRRARHHAEDALAACRDASRALPIAAWPHVVRAGIYASFTLDSEAALEAARQAASLDPWDARIRFQVAYAAYQTGETEEALRELGEAILRNASLANAHETWIWILALHGRVDEAVDHYEARVEEQPTPSDRMNLGVALLRAKRPAEAGDALGSLWRENPDLVGVAPWYAIALHRLGRTREAVDVLEETIGRRQLGLPAGTDTLLAELYLRLGEPEKARSTWLRAVKRNDATRPYDERNTAYAAAFCAEPAAAREWCVRNLLPANAYTPAHIECGIGEAFHARGDLDQCIAYLDRALALSPRYRFLRQLRAFTHLLRGDLEAAVAMFSAEDREFGGIQRDVDWGQGRFAAFAEAVEGMQGLEIQFARSLGLENRVDVLQESMLRLDRRAAWARRLAALKPQRDSIREGAYEAPSAREALDAGEVARCMGVHASAVRYYREAFETYLREFRWEGLRVRFRAARAAVLAAVGADAEQRLSLHAWARERLEEELEEWRIRLAERTPRGRVSIGVLTPQLWHWKYHLDLASVRDAEALAKLPDEERALWETFWREVDEVLATHAR